MGDARIQAELVETKAELQRLRERVSAGIPTVHKDLSLISLVPKWSGLKNGIPLEEFLTTVETSTRLGFWDETDKLQIAALRLNDAARHFFKRMSRITFSRCNLAGIQGRV